MLFLFNLILMRIVCRLPLNLNLLGHRGFLPAAGVFKNIVDRIISKGQLRQLTVTMELVTCTNTSRLHYGIFSLFAKKQTSTPTPDPDYVNFVHSGPEPESYVWKQSKWRGANAASTHPLNQPCCPRQRWIDSRGDAARAQHSEEIKYKSNLIVQTRGHHSSW